MSDETAKPAATPGKLKIGGLGPKAQKLQAAREKAAHVNSGGKPRGTKKTNFQRKAV